MGELVPNAGCERSRCEAGAAKLLQLLGTKRGASVAYLALVTMADESGDGGGSSMASLLRDKLVGSDLEPLHVELTE